MKRQLGSKQFHSKIYVCLQKEYPAKMLLFYHNIPNTSLYKPPIKRHKAVKT